MLFYNSVTVKNDVYKLFLSFMENVSYQLWYHPKHFKSNQIKLLNVMLTYYPWLPPKRHPIADFVTTGRKSYTCASVAS